MKIVVIRNGEIKVEREREGFKPTMDIMKEQVKWLDSPPGETNGVNDEEGLERLKEHGYELLIRPIAFYRRTRPAEFYRKHIEESPEKVSKE